MFSLDAILACPACHRSLAPDAEVCSGCQRKFTDAQGCKDLAISQDVINLHTEAAYKIYARYYAPVALLVYWIIWRGRFVKHVRFFRGILEHGKEIVDLATGDGSLTRLALFGSRSRSAKNIIAIDISSSMLLKAKRKLPKDRTRFIRGDALQLPFKDASVSWVSCFGGFNSFPSGEKVMKELARVLRPGGVLRGSVLLLPQIPWRKKRVMSWIRQGYQTEVVTHDVFDGWVRSSGLNLTLCERHGDVLLFELRRER
jgi:SAM-dependent methyltransferase